MRSCSAVEKRSDLIVARSVRRVIDEMNWCAKVANNQKYEIATQKVLHTRHCTLVEKVTRRNHRDTAEGYYDVEVEHWYRAARLMWLDAKGQPQVVTRVGRRHQLLERQTASEAASKTA